MSGTRPTILALNPTAMTSGAERVLIDYLGHLQAAGWSVSCASPEGPLSEALTAGDLAWHELPELKLADGSRAAAMLATGQAWRGGARRITELVADADADLVLTNGLMGLPALRLARLATPVVWLVHDVVVRRDLQLIVRGAAGAVDQAIAVSECAADFPRSLNIATEVVLNGTPFPVPRAPVTMPTPPLIGVSAVLTPWKGHELFLEAAAQLDPAVRFEIMGGTPSRDAEYADRLRARSAQPDLAGRVAFLGHVTDPMSRLRTWSLAVSPSISPEACPLNVLEAMSVGVPMVVTDHGGAAELLGDAGLKVTPGDTRALADGMTRLLVDDELHRRCRLRGPHIIDESHRIEAVSQRFEAALLDVVTRRTRGSTARPARAKRGRVRP